jgi:hypothetical protein
MKLLIGLVVGLVFWSMPAIAQEKNDVGLVIGGTIVPSQSLAPGASLIGPSGNVLPTRTLNFDASLALGAEYDHRIVSGNRLAIYAGIDFLASPNDVQLSQRTLNAPKSYAYIFLTPHIRAKFNARGPLSPWVEFGGGYTRFLSSVPPTATAFERGRNTGTFEFGGGVDTRTVFRAFKRIPIGFRLEVRDFYSGLPDYNVRVTGIGSLQNNLAFTGGLLIRF